MRENKNQPAKINYFFKQSYTDLGNVISGLWKKNEETARRFGRKIGESFSDYGFWGIIPMIAYLFATISMYVFGTVACTFFSLTHITIILIINIGVYICALFMGCADYIYTSLHKIVGACPYCKNHYKIPVYVCSCSAEHNKLTPGKYGVIKRTCNCGKKLPTSILNGRSKLKAKCPMCNRMLDNALGVQESTPICIPVIGGPSVGKTCYITSVMKELIENVAPKTNSIVQFYDNKTEIAYRNMVYLYDKGIVQAKNQDLNPAAYNFFIYKNQKRVKRLLYFYDISGEAFTTTGALNTQRQYEYANGFIFVIDPLSIPKLRNKYLYKDEYGKHSVSSADTDEIFGSFERNYVKLTGLSKDKMSKIPCAVVVNKIDAFCIDKILGENVIREKMISNNIQLNKFDDVMSEEVKDFLVQNEMHNFVRNLQMMFKNVKFFAVSSIGHCPNGSSFNGNMTIRPFAWIASNADSMMREIFKEYV